MALTEGKDIKQLLEEYSKAVIELSKYEPLSDDWHAALWQYNELTEAIVEMTRKTQYVPKITSQDSGPHVPRRHLTNEQEVKFMERARPIVDGLRAAQAESGVRNIPWRLFLEDVEKIANEFDMTWSAARTRIGRMMKSRMI